MAWSRTGCQHSGMATPSSLLISLRLVRRMCRASLMSHVVVFFAWSNMLISSHSIGCCCPQVCSAMADFSVSPCLVAALCSFMWVLRALFVSPIYTGRNCKGSSTQLPTSSEYQPIERIPERVSKFSLFQHDARVLSIKYAKLKTPYQCSR